MIKKLLRVRSMCNIHISYFRIFQWHFLPLFYSRGRQEIREKLMRWMNSTFGAVIRLPRCSFLFETCHVVTLTASCLAHFHFLLRKPKTKRSKRFLESRAPKLIEDVKTAMIMKGGNTSQTITQALKDIVSSVMLNTWKTFQNKIISHRLA